MWISDNAGYIFLLLAVLIVGWMSIFYIRMNIVKKDEPPLSIMDTDRVERPVRKAGSAKVDENAITKKRML
jgi:hypothetical protein